MLPNDWFAAVLVNSTVLVLLATIVYQGRVIGKLRANEQRTQENDKQARWIIQYRQQMLDEARLESERVRKEAQERHKGEG